MVVYAKILVKKFSKEQRVKYILALDLLRGACDSSECEEGNTNNQYDFSVSW